MDPVPHSELKPHIDESSTVKAHELAPGIEVNQRRQDKIIAAIVRQDPRAILQDTVTLTDGERTIFHDRCDDTRLDKIRDSDYEAALAATPTMIAEPRSEQNLKRVWEKFNGDEHLQRRKRRIVSFVTKGTIQEQAAVQPDDLYIMVQQKCRSAVAFEKIMPEILAQVDDPKEYKQVLNDVGLDLYGSQWVYLQQARLAEAQAKGKPKITDKAPAVSLAEDRLGKQVQDDEGRAAEDLARVRHQLGETTERVEDEKKEQLLEAIVEQGASRIYTGVPTGGQGKLIQDGIRPTNAPFTTATQLAFTEGGKVMEDLLEEDVYEAAVIAPYYVDQTQKPQPVKRRKGLARLLPNPTSPPSMAPESQRQPMLSELTGREGQEPAYVLSYWLESPYGKDAGAPYTDIVGRPNSFRMEIFLSKQLSEQMADFLPRDPQLVRKLAEKFVLEKYTSSFRQIWIDSQTNKTHGPGRPPWEEWDAHRDNMVKLFFYNMLTEDGDSKRKLDPEAARHHIVRRTAV